MKYEVRTKGRDNKTYGIWNNDMCSFQYVEWWNGTETIDLEEANEECARFNSGHYN